MYGRGWSEYGCDPYTLRRGCGWVSQFSGREKYEVVASFWCVVCGAGVLNSVVFYLTLFNFKVFPGQQDIVYCTDVRELINRVCKARKISMSDLSLMKVGMDTGQGSLKIALTLLTDEDVEKGIY